MIIIINYFENHLCIFLTIFLIFFDENKFKMNIKEKRKIKEETKKNKRIKMRYNEIIERLKREIEEDNIKYIKNGIIKKR
jgi:hypothetical protein